MVDPSEIEIHCAHDELRDPVSLVPHPRNPNTHPQRQIDMLARIIAAQGWRAPISISSRSGYVVRGHGRLEAALALGCHSVPVDVQDYDNEAAELADLVADNRIAELAEIDHDVLSETMAAIVDLDTDAGLWTGFDGDEILEMVSDDENRMPTTPKNENTTERTSEYIEEAKEEWSVKQGQVWLLGNHRLLCGDSTSQDDIDKLMGGQRFDLLVTDPPYGVSYGDKNEFLNSISRGNQIQKKIENDHNKPEDMERFWNSVWVNLKTVAAEHAAYYMTGPGDLLLLLLLLSIRDAGWQLKHMLVWAKNNHVLGRSDYHYKHEPILYGWLKKHRWYGGGSQTSLWEIDKPHSSKMHPTMKPVELFERAIHNSSEKNDIVVDPFLGSGTTMVACEKLSRVCYGMEKDPEYCSVILKRFFELTGTTPKLHK